MSHWAIAVVGALFLTLSFLSFWASGSLIFLIPMVPYTILSICFLVLNRELVSEHLDYEIQIERNLLDQNEIQRSFTERLRKSRALQHKYLTYYNLRKNIENFSTYLSVEKLAALIVSEAYEFLKKGDRAALLLGSPTSGELSVVATRSLDSEAEVVYKEGDYFDYWVLKNRQPLLIGDFEKDFRFNIKRSNFKELFESAVIVPLSLESFGGGILRIHSSKKDAFSIDDLRLLQILSDLASTALLNSFLYLKTEELAIRDSLTGLYVQRYFKERLEEECRRSRSAGGRGFSLVFIDLDHFKKFNDQFGHTAGDIALSEISRLLQNEIGPGGIAARYGGEEFAAILFDQNLENAERFAERLRQSVENFKVKIRDKFHGFTISLGVAEFCPRIPSEELIRQADKALYRAKQEGRNRVCRYQ